VSTLFIQHQSQQSAPTVLSSDENFMRTVREQLQSLFEEFGVGKQELWFEECNSTLWQRDLSGDTCYKAVWLAKNLCENYDCAESFGYWLLTDLMDEHTALDSVFHGGYGLLTYNGIPKSGYQAMRFLRQLGDTQIGAGDGWFLTRRGKDFQLLLYHYCHYDNLYRYRYKRLSSPQEAYSVFQPGTVHQLHLNWMVSRMAFTGSKPAPLGEAAVQHLINGWKQVRLLICAQKKFATL
jgi:xylan 1,4-beta-xylosidase